MTGLRLRVRRPLARASSPGAAAGVALLALTAVAPGPVLADNGTSLIDMWPTINMMIFGGMTTPFIFWMAKRFPPPPPPDPPYLPPPPPPSYPQSAVKRKTMDHWAKQSDPTGGPM